MRKLILVGMMMAMAATVGMGCNGTEDSASNGKVGNLTPVKQAPINPIIQLKPLTDQEKLEASADIATFLEIGDILFIPAFVTANNCNDFNKGVSDIDVFESAKLDPNITGKILPSLNCQPGQGLNSYKGVMDTQLSFQNASVSGGTYDGEVTYHFEVGEVAIQLSYAESDLTINGRKYDFSPLKISVYDSNQDGDPDALKCGGTVTVDGHSCTVAADCKSCQF